MKNFDELSAIFPCYTGTGDGTELLFKTGITKKSPKKIHSFLQNMASFYTFDLIALRNQSGKRTGHRQQLPLPFSNRLLLITAKVRTARIAGDFTLGYVNKYAIKNIRPLVKSPYRTEIFLTGGHRLYSLWTPKTILKNMREATLAVTSPDENSDMFLAIHQCIELLLTLRKL
jgi:hypothetical protein